MKLRVLAGIAVAALAAGVLPQLAAVGEQSGSIPDGQGTWMAGPQDRKSAAATWRGPVVRERGVAVRYSLFLSVWREDFAGATSSNLNHSAGAWIRGGATMKYWRCVIATPERCSVVEWRGPIGALPHDTSSFAIDPDLYSASYRGRLSSSAGQCDLAATWSNTAAPRTSPAAGSLEREATAATVEMSGGCLGRPLTGTGKLWHRVDVITRNW